MYLLLKTIHVLAVVMFLGNIATGVFWKAHADRTRDPRLIAHVLHGIIRSDRYFTNPGVGLIVIAGFATALLGRLPILGTGWIVWSIVLLTIAGFAFVARVAPLQRRLLETARAGEAGAMELGALRAAVAQLGAVGHDRADDTAGGSVPDGAQAGAAGAVTRDRTRSGLLNVLATP